MNTDAAFSSSTLPTSVQAFFSRLPVSEPVATTQLSSALTEADQAGLAAVLHLAPKSPLDDDEDALEDDEDDVDDYDDDDEEDDDLEDDEEVEDDEEDEDLEDDELEDDDDEDLEDEDDDDEEEDDEDDA